MLYELIKEKISETLPSLQLPLKLHRNPFMFDRYSQKQQKLERNYTKMKPLQKWKAYRQTSLKKRKTVTLAPSEKAEDLLDSLIRYKKEFVFEEEAEGEEGKDDEKNNKVHFEDEPVLLDIFDEFHKTSYLRLQPDNRYLSKFEADTKTMDDFTANFKHVLGEIRQELNMTNANLFEEDLDEIVRILRNGSYRDKDIFSKNNTYKPPVLDDQDVKMKIKTADEADDESGIRSDFSDISPIWERLETNNNLRKNNGKMFQFTPAGFNLYRQNERHWLQRASISWDEVDRSRQRCEDWFEKHHPQFYSE